MKNLINTFFVAGLLVCSLACESVDNPGAINTIDETRTAKIIGRVFANTNERNDTTSTGAPQIQYEFPPEGTKILVEINSVEFITAYYDDGGYQPLLFETTVNASGEFEIDVPALPKSITADIIADSFVTDQIIEDPDNPGSGTTRRRLFNVPLKPEVTFTVGTNNFVRIFYGDESFE